MTNNKTVVPLTPVERQVLSDFAAGDVPADIATARKLSQDAVMSIISRRASMSRGRAADLIAEPESPLTAPLPPRNGGKTAKSAPAAAKPAVVLWDRNTPAAAPAGLVEPPVAQSLSKPVEPEPTDTIADDLDGLDALAYQIRDHVINLAQILARRHHARLLKLRIDDLEAQLGQARAELAAAENGGGQ